ncbi:MAG: phosphoglycolate phosphatase [Thermoanaerobaculia bacterium]|nr:phosphoglycolate phosphatase [Thermoanaerobaculia bacterium]
MSAVRVGAVAFDLDGTLIDSRHDLAAAINRMRRDLGRSPLAVDDVLGMIGEGARNLVRRALGGEVDEASLDHALSIFYRHYDDECTRRTRPFPGIDGLLAELAPRLPLALVTNKPERFSRRIVESLGWRDRFDPLIGGDTLATRKPDPAGLLAVCARHGLSPGDLVLVGDSRVDALAAAAAGCRFFFAAWGFARPEERLALAGPEAFADAESLARCLREGAGARVRT